LKNMSSSMGRIPYMKWKIKNNWNHQPVISYNYNKPWITLWKSNFGWLEHCLFNMEV
jgi:hypothetical protein